MSNEISAALRYVCMLLAMDNCTLNGGGGGSIAHAAGWLALCL